MVCQVGNRTVGHAFRPGFNVADPDSVGLEKSLRFSISNRLSGEAFIAGLGTTL